MNTVTTQYVIKHTRTHMQSMYISTQPCIHMYMCACTHTCMHIPAAAHTIKDG